MSPLMTRPLRAVLLVVLGGLLLLAGTATPAAAHNSLIRTSPADGTTVPRTPSELVLTFNEPGIALGTSIVVTGPTGPVTVGGARLVDTTVRQTLAGGAPAGRYEVVWRVTSDDGHPVTGRYAFTSSAAGAAGPPADPVSSTTARSGTGSPAQGLPVWVLVVLGVVLLVLVVARRARVNARTRASATGSAAPDDPAQQAAGSGPAGDQANIDQRPPGS